MPGHHCIILVALRSCSVTGFLFWWSLEAIVSPWSGTILAVPRAIPEPRESKCHYKNLFWAGGGTEIAEHLNVLKELRSTNRNLDASDLCWSCCFLVPVSRHSELFHDIHWARRSPMEANCFALATKAQWIYRATIGSYDKEPTQGWT